jgi:preprotein translocase subunit SecD
MAVDANVLINERIREEMRRGKTARAAVDAGYSNATRTIVDANVTTLIAAVILWWFGTGPIQGFAVTLTIGIFSSMFTALVMTRVILEAATRNRAHAKLSI